MSMHFLHILSEISFRNAVNPHGRIVCHCFWNSIHVFLKIMLSDKFSKFFWGILQFFLSCWKYLKVPVLTNYEITISCHTNLCLFGTFMFPNGSAMKTWKYCLGGSTSGCCSDLGTIFTISRCVARILGTKVDLPLI